MSTAQILNGKELAEKIKHKLRRQVVNERLRPALAVILIGDDPASHLYIKLKEKACQQIGIDFHKYLMPKNVSEKEVLETIDWLNNDQETNAILVQLPLPKHLNENKIITQIKPEKDADGFHPKNLNNEKAVTLPAPANAVYKLIRASETFHSDCQALVVANNEIFFRPIAKLLKQYHIKTEYINPKDKNFLTKTTKADILIIAVGKPNFIKKEDIKTDAIVIDVGTNRINGKTVGDVNTQDILEKASAVSPVPGGVGPMTIACLLENVIALTKNQPPVKTDGKK